MKNKMKTDKLGTSPEGTNLPPDAAPGEAFWKPFQRAWALLSIHPYGLVVYNNDRIVVPEPFRQAIICEIHKSQPGVSKSKLRFPATTGGLVTQKTLSLTSKNARNVLNSYRHNKFYQSSTKMWPHTPWKS